MYNEGYAPILKIMEIMEVKIGQSAMNFASLVSQIPEIRTERGVAHLEEK